MRSLWTWFRRPGVSRGRSANRRPRGFRPQLEPLEARTVPSGLGTVTLFNVPPAFNQATDITSSFGNLWTAGIAGNGHGVIGRITPAGNATGFPTLTPNSDPRGITAGPALADPGHVWYTEYLANKIGTIDQFGALAEYPVALNPVSIASGPNTVWFTDYSAVTSGKIGVVTFASPGGKPTITEYNTPSTPSSPLAVAPDDTAYFAISSYTIEHIDKNGNATFISPPTDHALFGPGMTVDSKTGDLWFTEGASNRIGRYSTKFGTLTEYFIPTANSNPFKIVMGPDGNPWFTEEGASQIGTVTAKGDIIEYPLNVSGDPEGITSSPSDGNIWFGDLFGAQVGRVQVSQAVGVNGNASEGQQSTVTVASVQDLKGLPASNFSATIFWGDGTHSPGRLIRHFEIGPFTILGNHTYGEEGTRQVRVDITDTANNTVYHAYANVVVADAALTANGVNQSPLLGVPFTGVAAVFSDADVNGQPGDFTATINWGDGNISAGTITTDLSSGLFEVQGTNTYAAAGTYTVTVTITDQGGSTTQATATFTVGGMGAAEQLPPGSDAPWDERGAPRRRHG
jgi:streptogramin lyase